MKIPFIRIHIDFYKRTYTNRMMSWFNNYKVGSSRYISFYFKIPNFKKFKRQELIQLPYIEDNYIGQFINFE